MIVFHEESMADNPKRNSGKRKTKEGSDAVDWNDVVTETLIKLFVEEVDNGNRPNGQFTKQAWQRIINGFHSQTGRNYDHTQLKNKYDKLRAKWNVWLRLKNETGIGFDDMKQKILASPEWWDSYLKKYPDAKSYRYGLPLLHDLQECMFQGLKPTTNRVWHPTSRQLPNDIDEDNEPRIENQESFVEETQDFHVGNNEDFGLPFGSYSQFDTFSNTNTNLSGTPTCSEETGAAGSSKKPKIMKNTTKNHKITGAARLANAIEKATEVFESQSTNNSAADDDMQKMDTCMKILRSDGVKLEDEIYLFAMNKFMVSPNFRHMFLVLSTNEERLKFLKYQHQLAATM